MKKEELENLKKVIKQIQSTPAQATYLPSWGVFPSWFSNDGRNDVIIRDKRRQFNDDIIIRGSIIKLDKREYGGGIRFAVIYLDSGFEIELKISKIEEMKILEVLTK